MRAYLGAGFCGLLALTLVIGCRRNISGSYLAADETAVCWLQLVRTPDNHLTGQLAASILKPDGSIERTSSSVTGAVDGENVTLAGSGFFGLQSFAAAGKFEGSTLTLTGEQAIPLTFKRTSISNYQTQEAALNSRSQDILKAKAAAEQQRRTLEANRNFAATINQLVSRMERFHSEADVHLERFPKAEQAYQAITKRMSDYVERERRLSGNQNANNARAQLSNAVTNGSNLTEQLHDQAESLESALGGNIKPIADQDAAFEQACHTLSAKTANLASSEAESISAACARLESAAPQFHQRYRGMSDGLAHLEQVYQREENSQQRLVQESEKLE
jgi:hypothetical protein